MKRLQVQNDLSSKSFLQNAFNTNKGMQMKCLLRERQRNMCVCVCVSAKDLLYERK